MKASVSASDVKLRRSDVKVLLTSDMTFLRSRQNGVLHKSERKAPHVKGLSGSCSTSLS
jgi:hypothetical protein